MKNLIVKLLMLCMVASPLGFVRQSEKCQNIPNLDNCEKTQVCEKIPCENDEKVTVQEKEDIIIEEKHEETPIVEEKPNIEEAPIIEETPIVEEKVEISETQKVYELVNEERVKKGLSPLEYRYDLQKAADKRAEEIVSYFSHTRPDGRRCFTVLSDNGIKYRAAGENIAYGQRSAQSVMDGWMNSDGHRANILSDKFSGICVGLYRQNGVNYWVQIFIG